MAKNHPLMKDVKNWILDSFSFMDGVGYDILFDDDIYGMENTKAISADIDGLTDFDFEKGKKNLLNSIPNKIKAEFPYLRITSEKDGKYFVMIIVLLDNNDYLEDKNIAYINLNESKESARKSIEENKHNLSVYDFIDYMIKMKCIDSMMNNINFSITQKEFNNALEDLEYNFKIIKKENPHDSIDGIKYYIYQYQIDDEIYCIWVDETGFVLDACLKY